MSTSDKIRFWSKVDIKGPNDCWLWTAGKLRGYGSFWMHRKNNASHQIAWILTNGSYDADLLVCHHCDNPPCCNPSHLFLGTSKDNMIDMTQKGRSGGSGIGENNAFSKLTEKEVLEIRTMLSKGRTQADVAQIYNVHPSCIGNIHHHRTWKHLGSNI